MEDNVDTFFPTYLPTERLATHNKHDKQRFKHKIFIHQSKNHDCNKKNSNFYYINEEEITELLT